jgi:hypothetical protein
VRISCLAKGYDWYGASIHTSAAEHLELSLKSLEPRDFAIEVLAFIANEGPPRRTLESLLEEHIRRFPKQVRARYRAKAGKLNIEYASKLRDSDSFARPGGIYAVAHVLPNTLDELSEAVVKALRLKPAIWNKIDASRLAEAIEKSKASLPTSPDKILNYMRQMDEAREASLRASTSIDALDINWAHFHHSARTLLEDPFFWSEIDDDSPHGNDTGSDLLFAFMRWNKRNPNASYDGYVDRLLSRWGLAPERALGQIDELDLARIQQDAEIALAFAAIKLRGSCDDGQARIAIAVLDERIEELSNAPERVQKFNLLRSMLISGATSSCSSLRPK